MKVGVFARLEVPVLRAHIKDGVPGKAGQCAIALAVKDAVPGCKEIFVTEETIGFRSNGKTLMFKTPSKAAAFIRRFDDTENKADPVKARAKLKTIRVVADEVRQ